MAISHAHVDEPKRNTNAVKVLDKAFDLLEAVGATEQGRSLTQLSADLNLPTATTFRLLQHLTRRGYVEQDPDSKLYFLGLRALVLRGGAIRAIQLAARARPFLREMMVATNCLSHLAVLREGQVVYIDRVETANTVAVFVPIGNRVPAYCTALGKVLLASLPAEELNRFLSQTQFVQFTPNTITQPQRLAEHLGLVRERGYAVDMQEQYIGVWCVAAPIRDYAGRTLAATSVSMRTEPSPERLDELIRIVTSTALNISREIGYRPQPMDEVMEYHMR